MVDPDLPKLPDTIIITPDGKANNLGNLAGNILLQILSALAQTEINKKNQREAIQLIGDKLPPLLMPPKADPLNGFLQGMLGSAASTLAIKGITPIVLNSPKFFKKLASFLPGISAENLPLFKNKTPLEIYALGKEIGQAEALVALTTMLKQASLWEFTGHIVTLLDVHPTAKIIKNTIIISGSGYLVKQAFELTSGKVIQMYVLANRKTTTRDHLFMLKDTGKINAERYSFLMEKIRLIKTETQFDAFEKEYGNDYTNLSKL